MIINYPTGLYNLFGSIEDTSNVTWYISNNEPPRSSDVIIKIPIAEELQPLPVTVINKKVRRQSFGDLVYTINEANNSAAASGKKQYSEGDILDFQEDNRENLGIPRGKRVEFRHNLNELDMESIGLDDEDVERFNSDVYDKKDELEQQYLSKRQDIGNIEIGIQEMQKKINESNKALNAILILDDEDLQKKVEDRKAEYESQMSELVVRHDELVEEVAAIVDNLNKIDMVAK